MKLIDGSEITINGETYNVSHMNGGWVLTNVKANDLSFEFIDDLELCHELIEELRLALERMSEVTTEDWNNNPVVKALESANEIQDTLNDLQSKIDS